MKMNSRNPFAANIGHFTYGGIHFFVILRSFTLGPEEFEVGEVYSEDDEDDYIYVESLFSKQVDKPIVGFKKLAELRANWFGSMASTSEDMECAADGWVDNVKRWRDRNLNESPE